MSTITPIWTESKIRTILRILDSKVDCRSQDLPIKLNNNKRIIGTYFHEKYLSFSLDFLNDPKVEESRAIELIRHEFCHVLVFEKKLDQYFPHDTRTSHGGAFRYACGIINAVPRSRNDPLNYREISCEEAFFLSNGEDIPKWNIQELLLRLKNGDFSVPRHQYELTGTCFPSLVVKDVAQKCTHQMQILSNKLSTCERDGEEKFICKKCHLIITKKMPAYGHSFSEWRKKLDSPYEDRICKRCGKIERMTKKERSIGAMFVGFDELTINPDGCVEFEDKQLGTKVLTECTRLFSKMKVALVGEPDEISFIFTFDNNELDNSEKVRLAIVRKNGVPFLSLPEQYAEKLDRAFYYGNGNGFEITNRILKEEKSINFPDIGAF